MLISLSSIAIYRKPPNDYSVFYKFSSYIVIKMDETDIRFMLIKKCDGCWSKNIQKQLGRCPTCFLFCVLLTVLGWGFYFYASLNPVSEIIAAFAGLLGGVMLLLHVCAWLVRFLST